MYNSTCREVRCFDKLHQIIYSAIFIVDIVKEKIAVLEAIKLGIPTFAMVDTNSDPSLVDFPIPSNDDASKSIDIILSCVATTIQEALDERETEKKSKVTTDTGSIKAKKS